MPLLLLALFLAVLALTWPSPPWEALTYGGAALAVIAPILFFPFARTFFLTFDLVFRPPEEEAG